MSKAQGWPWAAQNLQMPHPRDWQGMQMPCSSPGRGGGGGKGGWVQLELTDALRKHQKYILVCLWNVHCFNHTIVYLLAFYLIVIVIKLSIISFSYLSFYHLLVNFLQDPNNNSVIKNWWVFVSVKIFVVLLLIIFISPKIRVTIVVYEHL